MCVMYVCINPRLYRQKFPKSLRAWYAEAYHYGKSDRFWCVLYMSLSRDITRFFCNIIWPKNDQFSTFFPRTHINSVTVVFPEIIHGLSAQHQRLEISRPLHLCMRYNISNWNLWRVSTFNTDKIARLRSIVPFYIRSLRTAIICFTIVIMCVLPKFLFYFRFFSFFNMHSFAKQRHIIYKIKWKMDAVKTK